ncbi:MAG: hypothetical protein AAF363_08955 [Bacteroidota bacterium]
MKTISKNSINHLLIILSLLCIFSCKNKTPQVIPSGETEVIVPCSGTEYFSSGEIFRTNSIGESRDQVASKKKALSNARADLAAHVSTTVKAVTDNYLNSREFNNKEEVEERYESLNREVVNQEIRGSKVICEKQTRTAQGSFKSYIAIELDPKLILEAYNERLSSDERLKIDYDYEKFKKTFEEEMSRMAGG